MGKFGFGLVNYFHYFYYIEMQKFHPTVYLDFAFFIHYSISSTHSQYQITIWMLINGLKCNILVLGTQSM